MPLFGSKSNEPLDPELAACLHPDDGHAHSQLGRLQAVIHQTLLAGERVLNISVPRLSPGQAVVTTARLLVFDKSKPPGLWCSFSQPGLSAEITPPPTTGDQWSVVVRHPDIYPTTEQTYGSGGASDNIVWMFRRRVHADALLDAINAVQSVSAEPDGSTRPQSSSAGPLDPDDPTLTDAEWLAICEGRFRGTVDPYYGSPESLAEGGKDRYDHQDFGTAIFFFQKSIDLLHTNYLFGQMKDRQPSPADTWIVNGYLSALGASLSLHPGAPVDQSVREVTHRLRTISSACERTGATPALYLNALAQLADTAPSVNVDDVLW